MFICYYMCLKIVTCVYSIFIGCYGFFRFTCINAYKTSICREKTQHVFAYDFIFPYKCESIKQHTKTTMGRETHL